MEASTVWAGCQTFRSVEEGEEAFEVEQTGGQALLEQDFAGASVAGFAHPVTFPFSDLAFDDGSSSQLFASRWSGLFGPSGLESRLVEVQCE